MRLSARAEGATRSALLSVSLLCGATDVGSACPSKTSVEKEVERLIRGLDARSGEKVQSAVDGILGLGKDAIPAIICRLDDRRPMRQHLVHYPGHSFERWVHYTPEEVVDRLHTILTELAERPVECDLESGGSDAERRACVVSWRKWLAEQ